MSEDERRNLPIEERENIPSGDDVEAHMLGDGSSERENIDLGTEREAFPTGDA